MDEDNVLFLEFTEGIFEGVSFELNTDDLDVTENENGEALLSYSVGYDENDEKIKEHGASVFLDAIGKMLLEGLYSKIEEEMGRKDVD